MKKKLFSLALALSMCFSLTLSACATGTGDTTAPDDAESPADSSAAPQNDTENTVDTFVSSSEDDAANSIETFANSAGDTEIREAYGTITLSNPILYVISPSDLEKIDTSSMKATTVGLPYDENAHGYPAAEFPSRDVWPEISAVYAIPAGTIITFPSGIETASIFQMDVIMENGVLQSSEMATDLLPGYDAIQAPEPDPAYIAVISLEYTELPEGSTTVLPSGGGASGSSVGGYTAGSIALYVPKDTSAKNPFASSTSATPTTPQTPQTPAAPTTSTTTGSTAFTDVAADAYYADPVKWAVEKGITSGTTATTFSPNNTCTTAQILTFLWRAKGSPEPTSTANPFTDVKESAYYYKAALWAKENNVLPLPFNPSLQGDGPCTRGMAMLYIWRASGFLSAKNTSNFTDVAATTLYAPAVDWAVEKGITSGTTATTFSPDNTCTRAQIVTFLYRALGK